MQTSYNATMTAGRAGMFADNGAHDVLSRSNDAVVIPFGVAVCRGTDPDVNVKLPTSSAEVAKVVGVALVDPSVESVSQFAVESDVPVLHKGRVWVEVTEDVTPDSTVYVRFADGVADATITQKGSFGASADTSTAAALTGAKYLTSASAGGLAILELNL